MLVTLLARRYATETTAGWWLLAILGGESLVIAVLLTRATHERVVVRRAVMTKLQQQYNNNVEFSPPQEQQRQQETSRVVTVERNLQLHSRHVTAAHRTCGCLAKDTTTTASTSTTTTTTDLCQCLWKTLSSLCCGYCCGAWFQCCGMCAISQEDRELQRLLPAQALHVDYITFQPYADYHAKLEQLRSTREMSFWKHLSNLSQLSRYLTQWLAWALLVLALIAASHLDRHFDSMNWLVVVLTFLQAFSILYFVHWRWHKFDLSLDAVVKYFSSGFVLCTTLALVYEMLLSVVLQVLGYLVIAILAVVEQRNVGETIPKDDPEAARAYMEQFVKDNVWIFVVMVFLNAFVMAAMVEEITKYFGFWMVEHPDWLDPRDLVSSTNTEEEVGRPEQPPSGPLATSTTTTAPRPLTSLGAGITVAMVTTALGFACCENLMYVFVYTPPNVSNEIATLVARSIFPVHPLAAAIQSIGVCQRDLEGNRKIQLGRIILPAVLLHGSFDFCLMLLDLLKRLYSSNDDEEEEGDVVTADDDTAKQSEVVDLASELPALTCSVVIVLLGVFYYVFHALAQRRRLQELDRRQAGYEPVI